MTKQKYRRPYPFFIYYADKISINTLEQFDLVVLEPDLYHDVHPLKNTALAYLSIGEIHPTRPYFQEIKESALLLGTHKVFESHYVSLKDDEWLAHLTGTIIPDIIAKGFTGLMLDTVDSLLMSHSHAEVITLINSLRHAFPDLYLMQNRGFAIMDETDVNAFLLESTLSDLNDHGEFAKVDPLEHRRDLTKAYYSVDYWDLGDKEGIDFLYMQAYALGYIPYVTSRDLTQPPSYSTDPLSTLPLLEHQSEDINIHFTTNL